ncbi:MAG: hypothetical protein LBS01_11325 [Prevotellaceae bacterium]|jgi:hypothetical protein|nr:hypothetical protein [Prevotellaceae bacterium]
MKKIFISTVLLCITIFSFAQLTVQDNGNVLLGTTTSTVLSKFAISTLGDAETVFYLSGSAKSYSMKIVSGGAGGTLPKCAKPV